MSTLAEIKLAEDRLRTGLAEIKQTQRAITEAMLAEDRLRTGRMLTAEATKAVINCSVESLVARLAVVPISAADIERIYGLAPDQAQAMSDQAWAANEHLRDVDDWRRVVSLTATFADSSAHEAAQLVSEWLAGRDLTVKYNCYAVGGSYVLLTMNTPPKLIGPLYARPDVDGSYVFRLVAEGYEAAFDRGETVPSQLYRCSAKGYAQLDEIYSGEFDVALFAAWKAEYCYPLHPSMQPRTVMHVECSLRLLPSAIHELAQHAECTMLRVDIDQPASVWFKA